MVDASSVSTPNQAQVLGHTRPDPAYAGRGWGPSMRRGVGGKSRGCSIYSTSPLPLSVLFFYEFLLFAIIGIFVLVTWNAGLRLLVWAKLGKIWHNMKLWVRNLGDLGVFDG